MIPEHFLLQSWMYEIPGLDLRDTVILAVIVNATHDIPGYVYRGTVDDLAFIVKSTPAMTVHSIEKLKKMNIIAWARDYDGIWGYQYIRK